MSNKTQTEVLKLNLSVNKANEAARRLLKTDDRRELYEFVDEYLKRPAHEGTATDFCSFASTLAYNNEYAIACDILQCGKDKFPNSSKIKLDIDKYESCCHKTKESKQKAQTYYLLKASSYFHYCNYDKTLSDIQKAISYSDKTDLNAQDGYLYFMSAICKIASATKNDAFLDESSVLDIYNDFNVAAMFADCPNANYKDMLLKKVSYLIEKFNVPIPGNNSELQRVIENR